MRLAVLGLLMGAVLCAEAQPARIIVIRHAEKPANDEVDPHLSPDGQVRAQRLVRWLTQGAVLGTNGTPAAFYAVSPGRGRQSVRCRETIEPTAAKLGQRVQTPYKAGDYEVLARDLRHSQALRGKNVVVCWVHDFLPQLAAALGVNPPPSKWKSEDFESAYVITFPNGKAALEKTKQRLKKQ
jgi:hypothetical protein